MDQDLIKRWFTVIADNNLKLHSDDTIDDIVKLGLDVNCITYERGSEGNSSLMYAIRYHSKNILKFLLDQPNLDINYKSPVSGHHAINVAANVGFVYIIEMLLKHPNIDVNAQVDGITALMKSSLKAHEIREDNKDSFEIYKKIAKLYLSHPKIDLKIKNQIGFSFLDCLLSEDKCFLIDLELQKIMLKNNPENILFLKEHNLLHPDMVKEDPKLFKANDWGLVF